jgi:hypothetical protein
MFKLVKNNVEALHQDIPAASLCKTFTDALEVIRTIGIGYLWIDSLCIVQDDDQDVKAPRPHFPPTLKIPSKRFFVVPRDVLYQSL